MKRHESINIHPGEILKEDVILPVGLTIGEAAEYLDTSRLTLSKILNGKSSITPNMALRIEFVFGGKADFWLRLQRNYDLIAAKNNFNELSNLKKFEYQD